MNIEIGCNIKKRWFSDKEGIVTRISYTPGGYVHKYEVEFDGFFFGKHKEWMEPEDIVIIRD